MGEREREREREREGERVVFFIRIRRVPGNVQEGRLLRQSQIFQVSFVESDRLAL